MCWYTRARLMPSASPISVAPWPAFRRRTTSDRTGAGGFFLRGVSAVSFVGYGTVLLLTRLNATVYVRHGRVKLAGGVDTAGGRVYLDGMTHTTISRNGAGIPPTRRSRQAAAPRHLEAKVVLTDGTARVERTERNTPEGRRAMDHWAFERNASPKVDYIAVRLVDRIAGYERSR